MQETLDGSIEHRHRTTHQFQVQRARSVWPLRVQRGRRVPEILFSKPSTGGTTRVAHPPHRKGDLERSAAPRRLPPVPGLEEKTAGSEDWLDHRGRFEPHPGTNESRRSRHPDRFQELRARSGSGMHPTQLQLAPRSRQGRQSSPAEKLPAKRSAAPHAGAWADLIRRIYEVDPLVCSNCGGPMKIVAFITGRKAIRAILASMRKSAARASAGGADGILRAQRWRYTSRRSSSELASPLGCTRPEIGAIQIVPWRQRDQECGPARSGGVRERDSDPRRK